MQKKLRSSHRHVVDDPVKAAEYFVALCKQFPFAMVAGVRHGPVIRTAVPPRFRRAALLIL